MHSSPKRQKTQAPPQASVNLKLLIQRVEDGEAAEAAEQEDGEAEEAAEAASDSEKKRISHFQRQ
eukprot:1377552-Prorocentrum_lima.AAC.1